MSLSRRQLLQHAGCACLIGPFAELQASEPAPVPDSMQFLAPRTVVLQGHLEKYIQLSISKWSKGVLPYHALASFFSQGRPLSTWEGKTLELFASGEMWGKAVRSASLFYRYTGDPQLKAILQRSVAELLAMKRENGTLSCSPVNKQPDGAAGDLWERAYVLLGLDDYYSWVEQDPKVLQAMIDEADATLRQVGPPPKKRIVDLGWSEGLVGGNNIESSTILEPIVRLYQRTGHERYLAFARYIVETEGGGKGHNIIAEVLEGRDPKDVGGTYPKAYEMVSLFEGVVEYYRATANERWRRASLEFFHRVIDKEITIIGNGGGDQPYHPGIFGEAWDNTALEQTNTNIQRMMETCTGVTWMKYCSQILRLTASPLAADYIEMYAYNGLIGAMKPEGDGFSYVNLLNGVKTNKQGWGTEIEGVYITCCNLNGPEGLGYLPLVAVMKRADAAVVNLYNPATAQVPLQGGGQAHLKIMSRYPVDGDVRIEVNLEGRRHFALDLRIPAWSQATLIEVNGKPASAHPGTYTRIERQWSPGDVVTLSLDMRCRLIQGPRGSQPGSDRFRALIRGPLVLARDENNGPHYSDPVDIIAQDGFVAAELVQPAASASTVEVRVPVRGGFITMVDYASVNSWQGKRVQTWLPLPA